MIKDRDKLFLAIPNKGRLKDPTINLLKRAGYQFRIKERALYAGCKNANINILFIRTEDIPSLVNDGVVDLGITGEDLVLEANANVEKILRLDYGACRLAVALSEDDASDIKKLDGKTIATSFPNLSLSFFKQNNVQVECVKMNGALEIMIALGLADAIVDVVETGDTLRENKLKTIADIGQFQAALIGRKGIENNVEVEVIKRRLSGIIHADRYSMLEYNIKMINLKEAEKITPGFQSPTISELDDKEWVAVKAMVEKSRVVETMDALLSIGATAILETEIRNCRI